MGNNLQRPNSMLGIPIQRADGRWDNLPVFALVNADGSDPTGPAASTPLAGSVTAAALTPTQGGGSFAGGVATIGPLTPQLARDVVLKLWTTNGAQFTAQVFDSIDGGATRLPLTALDQPIGGPYTVPVNSAIGTVSLAGTTMWLVITVTAGTLNYLLAQ